MVMFADRVDAGRRLTERLLTFRGEGTIILAIPRGGVVVGRVVAEQLGAELDIVIPRKMGAPGNPELAIGAVMHDGTMILNEDVLEMMDVPQSYIDEEKKKQMSEARRRMETYRRGKPYPSLKGRVVIIVDDGIATGATVAVAARWVKAQQPSRTVVAVPVGPPDSIKRLKNEADEVIYILAPAYFYAVGQFYDDFSQVEDEDVINLLK